MLYKRGYGTIETNSFRDGATGLSAVFFVVQSVASPVLGNILQQAKVRNGMRYIKIPGVPYQAAYAFIRYLYSSWYVGGYQFVYSFSLLAIMAKVPSSISS